MGMGRYNAPAGYILLSASAPVQKPTMRPAHPLSNTMFNIGNWQKEYISVEYVWVKRGELENIIRIS